MKSISLPLSLIHKYVTANVLSNLLYSSPATFRDLEEKYYWLLARSINTHSITTRKFMIINMCACSNLGTIVSYSHSHGWLNTTHISFIDAWDDWPNNGSTIDLSFCILLSVVCFVSNTGKQRKGFKEEIRRSVLRTDTNNWWNLKLSFGRILPIHFQKRFILNTLLKATSEFEKRFVYKTRSFHGTCSVEINLCSNWR